MNMDETPRDRKPDEVIRKRLKLGLLICAFTVFGLAGFAAVYEIAGAVLTSGHVVVDGSAKRVQHPTGGVVGQILVKDGTNVRDGDVVLRLDETVTRSNLMLVLKQLDELEVRQLRLKAERDGRDDFDLPASLASRAGNAELSETLAAEHRLFSSRRTARLGLKAQLRERIAQLEQEIGGLTIQSQAKAREISFVLHELEGSKSLWEKNLYPVTKYTAIQRDAARLEGERGQLIAQAAQARGKISEIALQMEQIEQDLQAEVMRDLRDLQGKLAELSEKKVTAEDQLKRVELKAPQAGVVHQLTVHTVGGVVQAGETIMQIVPQEEELVVEVKLSPSDIDMVHVGQVAYVRFTALNQRTTPEIEGVVERISADLSRDQTQPTQAFYTLRIALTKAGVARLNGVVLVPGMPAEVHLTTGYRTMLSYLIKPMTDQLARAFRER